MGSASGDDITILKFLSKVDTLKFTFHEILAAWNLEVNKLHFPTVQENEHTPQFNISLNDS